MKVDFTRTITTTTIKASSVKVEDGNITATELEPIKVIGKSISKEKAEKMVKKENPDLNVVVTDIVEEEEIRGLDFDTFMKYSVPVVRPESQQKKA